MNVATALNSRYMRYTCVMLTSLFVNHPDTDIHAFLLHNDLTAEDKKHLQNLADKYHKNIHFLFIDREAFSDSLPTTDVWPLEAYFRLMLVDILPPWVDRLLYLDVDMIINKSLEELYRTDFEDNYFCVCRDMPTVLPFPDIRNEFFKEHMARGFTYFNSGMMLWNIEGLRGKYTLKTYIDLAESLNYQMLAPDQDLLNFLHWNQVKFVDEYQYNLFSRFVYNNGIHYQDVKKETSIIHFAGMKPWEGEYVHYDIEQLWWDYARLTPFYIELMEEFLYNCINKPVISDTMLQLSKEKEALRAELDKTGAMCRKLLQLLER